MNHTTENMPKSSGDLLRIGGTNLKIVQFMDYPDFTDPNGSHRLIINFSTADLNDRNGNSLYNGQLIVRVNTTVTPASLAMITQLLQPFSGYFVMIVTGSYEVHGSYAEVIADDVPWTNIQPTHNQIATSLEIVPMP